MANPEHLAILKQGVEAWNRWRQKNPDVMPNLGMSSGDEDPTVLSTLSLEGADLSHLFCAQMNRINLAGAKLDECKLAGANVTAADLTGCTLNSTDCGLARLDGAKLDNAHCGRTNFGSASLQGCSLVNARLNGAQFYETELTGADFSRAHVGFTIFSSVDLSLVVGLDCLVHDRSSSVDIETVYKSRGTLPLSFLRGVGLLDGYIAYLSSMIPRRSLFYSCFISYSTKDREFADRLHADLQAIGVRCWFAPHHIQGGKKIQDQIGEAIRWHDRLLLILSEDSMASEWVRTEIANARQREVKEKRRVLFPISLVPYEKIKDWEAFDADTGKDSAREIREYFIPDFSNWKDHDSYQQAFQRLLRDLKAEQNR